MEFTHVPRIPDVLRCRETTRPDDRGFFKEVIRIPTLGRQTGITFAPLQWNHSYSKRNVLRGIHVASYAKLVYVPVGQVRAFLIDLRPGRASFCALAVEFLGHHTSEALYLPPGIGNAFVAETDNVHYLYLVGQEYDPRLELTVRWNDPSLGIPWGVKDPIVSQRDKDGLTLDQYVALAPTFLSSD